MRAEANTSLLRTPGDACDAWDAWDACEICDTWEAWDIACVRPWVGPELLLDVTDASSRSRVSRVERW